MNLRLFYGITIYVIWFHSLKTHADGNKTLLCFYLAQGIDRLGMTINFFLVLFILFTISQILKYKIQFLN